MAPNIDYGRLSRILVTRASTPDEFTRLTAITWLHEFVGLGQEQLLPYEGVGLDTYSYLTAPQPVFCLYTGHMCRMWRE